MRYFYKDPLEAAYMSKHYGIKLQVNKMKVCIKNGESPYYPDNFLPLDVCNALVDCIRKLHWEREEQRFYIHPDSVHLLEPQLNDLGVSPDVEKHFNYLWIGGDGVWFSAGTKDESVESTPCGAIQIIQRDCKAFFWPEVEDAA